MSFPPPPQGGRPPAPGGFPGNWQQPAPAPQPGGGRQWVLPVMVGAMVVIVVVALAVTLGGNTSTTGRAAAQTDARTVAQTFANLESARYNADQDTPNPSSAAYGGVSCRADLAEMRKDDGAPPKPTIGPRLYSFAVESIKPASGGRRLLTIARTTLATKEVGDGLFYLQREGGRWKVCGLFPDTEPPDPDSGSGSGSPSGGSSPGGSDEDAVRAFADSFAHAVSTGVVEQADMAICPNDPQPKNLIESWTNAHAHVTVESVTGTAVQLDVTEAGQAPRSAVIIVLRGTSTPLCIEAVAQ